MSVSPLVTAGVTILGVVLCYSHASTREEYAFLLVAAPYGYLLEQAAIVWYEAYHYNADAFPVMLFDVPVSVAFTWASILYAAWQTGRYLGLSRSRLPLFVGLFALHIDLAMDVVAIRIPYWTWGVDGLWFGVPLGNFFAWFAIGFLFVGAFVALERYEERPFLRLAGTTVGSLALLLVALFLWAIVSVSSQTAEILLFLAIVEVAIVAVMTDDVSPRPVALSVVAIPLIAHVFFLLVGFWIGFYEQQPLALAVALGMLANGIGIHAIPLVRERRAAAAADV